MARGNRGKRICQPCLDNNRQCNGKRPCRECLARGDGTQCVARQPPLAICEPCTANGRHCNRQRPCSECIKHSCQQQCVSPPVRPRCEPCRLNKRFCDFKSPCQQCRDHNCADACSYPSPPSNAPSTSSNDPSLASNAPPPASQDPRLNSNAPTAPNDPSRAPNAPPPASQDSLHTPNAPIAPKGPSSSSNAPPKTTAPTKPTVPAELNEPKEPKESNQRPEEPSASSIKRKSPNEDKTPCRACRENDDTCDYGWPCTNCKDANEACEYTEKRMRIGMDAKQDASTQRPGAGKDATPQGPDPGKDGPIPVHKWTQGLKIWQARLDSGEACLTKVPVVYTPIPPVVVPTDSTKGPLGGRAFYLLNRSMWQLSPSAALKKCLIGGGYITVPLHSPIPVAYVINIMLRRLYQGGDAIAVWGSGTRASSLLLDGKIPVKDIYDQRWASVHADATGDNIPSLACYLCLRILSLPDLQMFANGAVCCKTHAKDDVSPIAEGTAIRAPQQSVPKKDIVMDPAYSVILESVVSLIKTVTVSEGKLGGGEVSQGELYNKAKEFVYDTEKNIWADGHTQQLRIAKDLAHAITPLNPTLDAIHPFIVVDGKIFLHHYFNAVLTSKYLNSLKCYWVVAIIPIVGEAARQAQRERDGAPRDEAFWADLENRMDHIHQLALDDPIFKSLRFRLQANNQEQIDTQRRAWSTGIWNPDAEPFHEHRTGTRHTTLGQKSLGTAGPTTRTSPSFDKMSAREQDAHRDHVFHRAFPEWMSGSKWDDIVRISKEMEQDPDINPFGLKLPVLDGLPFPWTERHMLSNEYKYREWLKQEMMHKYWRLDDDCDLRNRQTHLKESPMTLFLLLCIQWLRSRGGRDPFLPFRWSFYEAHPCGYSLGRLNTVAPGLPMWSGFTVPCPTSLKQYVAANQTMGFQLHFVNLAWWNFDNDQHEVIFQDMQDIPRNTLTYNYPEHVPPLTPPTETHLSRKLRKLDGVSLDDDKDGEAGELGEEESTSAGALPAGSPLFRNMPNLSNTCYISTGIQTLFSIPAIKEMMQNRSLVLEKPDTESGRQPKAWLPAQYEYNASTPNNAIAMLSATHTSRCVAMIAQLRHIFARLDGARAGNVTSPEMRRFVESVTTLDRDFDGNAPNDSQRFLETVVEAFVKITDSSDYRPVPLLKRFTARQEANAKEGVVEPLRDAVVQRADAYHAEGRESPVQGLLEIQIVKERSWPCGAIGRTFEEARYLQLFFPEDVRESSVYTLYQLLDNWRTETLAEEYGVRCAQHGDDHLSLSQLCRLTVVSENLMISFSREHLSGRRQLNEIILPERLDLHSYADGVQLPSEAEAVHGRTILGIQPIYRLQAMTLYKDGHYITFNTQRGRWVCFDDLKALPVVLHPQSFLNQGWVATYVLYVRDKANPTMPLDSRGNPDSGHTFQVGADVPEQEQLAGAGNGDEGEASRDGRSGGANGLSREDSSQGGAPSEQHDAAEKAKLAGVEARIQQLEQSNAEKDEMIAKLRRELQEARQANHELIERNRELEGQGAAPASPVADTVVSSLPDAQPRQGHGDAETEDV